MSIGPVSAAGATQLPIGTPARTPEEKAAMGFERMLLGQLTEQLAKSVQTDDESASAATQTYRDMLPGALADALIVNGGIGLATSLVEKVK
jgi:Rod binding domain-containing protein